MWKKAILAVLVVLAMAFYIPLPHLESQDQKTSISTLSYPNSDVSVLWVRRNGSDPGFDYGGSNVSPSVGMNYFGTNVLQVHWSYNWTDIANVELFPTDSELYIQIDQTSTYGPGDALAVANHALTDDRIKGAFIDDFLVGQQSPQNMSAIYENLTVNDGALGYHLTLGLIVYNRNYYIQSPYTWDSISTYFDVVHFWFFPTWYSTLYPDFVGYEDAFMELRSWLPTKEYWLGIYLHYYNAGSYPYDFTYDQMSVASRLIKDGFATRLSILENFWIQHNPDTSVIVRDFVNDELQMDYSSIWNATTTLVNSYRSGTLLPSSLLTNVHTIWASNYTFTSTHLQTVTVTNTTGTAYLLQNARTGAHVNVSVSDSNLSFIAEPGESYKLYSQPMDYYELESPTYILTPTSWDYRTVTLSSILYLNSTLWINNSIVRVTDNMHKNTIGNGTPPDFGIIFNVSDSAKLYLNNCTIEPTLRAFPYYFNMTWNNSVGQNRVISIRNSTLACYAGMFTPVGYIYIIDSLLFQAQPNGETYFSTLWLNGAGSANECQILRSVIWNSETPGLVSVFLLPGTLASYNHIVIDGCTIAGGSIGLWVDMTYTLTGTQLHITNLTIYMTKNPSTDYLYFMFQGETTKAITISFFTVRTWNVNATDPAPSVTFRILGLDSGRMYRVYIDGMSARLLTASGSGVVSFTYSGPWSEHQFEIVATSITGSISPLVNLIFIMFAVGIVVGIVAEGTNSLRKMEMRTTEKMVKSLLNMVIYIVIGIASLGVMYSIVA